MLSTFAFEFWFKLVTHTIIGYQTFGAYFICAKGLFLFGDSENGEAVKSFTKVNIIVKPK